MINNEDAIMKDSTNKCKILRRQVNFERLSSNYELIHRRIVVFAIYQIYWCDKFT